MNIINKLTLQHMKLNKKRTLVTIMGIIISVAMITAVSTVVYSIMDYAARCEMEDDGYFHLKFENYYYRDNNKIIDELDVENYSMMKVLGDYVYGTTGEKQQLQIESYVYEGDTQSFELNAFRIIAVQDNYYEMMNIKLLEGKYPENDKELLLPIDMCEVFGDAEIGTAVSIGGKEYTVCGIIGGTEFEWRNLQLPNAAMTDPFYTSLDVSSLQGDDLVSGYFYAGGVPEDLDERAEALQITLQASGVPEKTLIGEEQTWYCEGTTITYNYDVLEYLGISKYDNVTMVMEAFKLILIVIIMIGSTSLIANGFIISISERSCYLGMLASVGATRKQKRSSVYFEGFIEGIIAIPTGIIVGIGGIALTFKLIEPLIDEISGKSERLTLIVNGEVIIWTVVFSVLTIFLSARTPAKRASKISAIDAIRQTQDVKITSGNVKTMGITRKIFGFEGDLALKNLKRNKKRYRVTVFSMFISLTLFISVYSLIHYAKESVYMEMEEISCDICIEYFVGNEGAWFFEDTGEELTMEEGSNVINRLLTEGKEYIDSYQKYMYVGVYNSVMELKTDNIKALYNDDYQEFKEKGSAFYTEPEIAILTMEEEDLKNYLKSIDVNYEEFVADKDNVILYDEIWESSYRDSVRTIFYGAALNNKLTDLTYLNTIYQWNKSMGEDGKYDIEREEVGTTDINFHIYQKEEKFMGLSRYEMYILITPEKYKELEQYGTGLGCYIALNVNNDEKLVEIYEDIMTVSGYSEDDFCIYNNVNGIEETESYMLLISIFAYGFIILISLVCIANIVNTISTSLALRRKEFAMLKSVGMTDRAFNKMIAYESAFYGIKAVIFGLPFGTMIMLYIRYIMTEAFSVEFGIPWMGYVIAVIGVFVVIGMTMLYSSRKIKKANIIEALRNENA